MAKPTGIIIIEGADASGKTTLASELISMVGEKNSLYIHAGISDDYWGLAYGCIVQAISESNSKLVIIDRCWMSEMCYGSIFRQAPQYIESARCFDRLLLKHGAINIIASPKNALAHIHEFNKIKEERHEEFKDITKAVQWYHNLCEGNLAVPADNYATQFTAFGDYLERPDTIRYDRFTDDKAKFSKKVLKLLKKFRKQQLPEALKASYFSLIGHVGSAEIVFIGGGERNNVCEEDCESEPWPYFTNEPKSSMYEVNKIIHKSGLNEAQAVYINAFADSTMKETFRLIKLLKDNKVFVPLDKLGLTLCKHFDVDYFSVKDIKELSQAIVRAKGH